MREKERKRVRGGEEYKGNTPLSETAVDSDFTDSAYSRIYGRLPLPNRGYLPPPPPHPRAMYVGEWD